MEYFDSSKGSKSKVILIYPKIGTELKESGGAIGLPYSILTVAAEICDKFAVTIIDQRTDFNWRERLKREISNSCLCVGISSMTGNQLKNALEAAKTVRETNPRIPIIWGGVHVTTLPEQSLGNKYIDIVVRGEGEKTCLELVTAMKEGREWNGILGLSFKKEGKIIHTPSRPPLDLNDLKPIPWELIPLEKYFMKGQLTPDTKRELDLGETSRGCPYACTFCYNSTKTGFTWRAMSPEKTVGIIKDAIKRFKIDGFWLRDDNFFVDLRRVEKILDLMKAEGINIYWYCPGIRMDTINRMSPELFRKLIDSGIRRFRPGIESGNDRVLKLINKNMTIKDIISANLRLKETKIPVEYSYIIGFPTETLEEMYDTVNLVLKLKKDNPYSVSHNINIYSPYPGTKLYGLSISKGLKEPKSILEWSEYHHLNINLDTYNKDQEKIIQSISELSYYTAGFVYENFPLHLKILSFPLRSWCEFRFHKKIFKFRADLNLVKKARRLFLGI